LTESNLIAAPSAATNHPFVKTRLCKRSIRALGVADAKGQIIATRISQEKAVVDQLIATPPALALIVDVRAMASGFYSKKNLWTLFGMIPFYVMGGAAVAFQLVDKDGVLRASDLVPIHGGSSIASTARPCTEAPAPSAKASRWGCSLVSLSWQGASF
jgi:hypothetical protein